MYIYVYETVHVTGVSLNTNSIVLDTVWQTEQLTATITPSNADDQTVVWSTSDSTVATVSQSWLVTCVSPWDATITVTTNDWWYTATCGVTDQSWWQPWVNTIAYYPFSTDFSDQSWNWYDLTWYNSATIWTLNWLSCLDLTASQSYLWTTVSWIPQWWQARTEMFWVKWSALWNYPTHQYGRASFNEWSTIWTNNSNPNWILWSNYWDNILWTWPISVSVWHHVAVVINGSWSAGQVMYVDGVAWPDASLTINTQGTTLYIGKNRDNNYLNWYMSNFIIEDKARTAQEISDYFNQTKWDYWIS